MKIDIEVEFDSGKISLRDLFDEVEDRLESVGCLLTEGGQKKLEPIMEEMRRKLIEVFDFIGTPTNRLIK